VLPWLPATREQIAYPARLLDHGLAHASAAVAGRAERYGRGETAHTIHVWWARRPHAAMRALVFAALCKDQSPAARDLLDRLGRSATVAPDVLAAGQALLAAQYPARPALLDMFSGGGTIPLEALRLGADAHAVELNQLAAFLTTCNLVYSQQAGAGDPAALLGHAGARVLDRLTEYTRAAFPLRGASAPARAATYFWTYRTPCPGCGHGLLLARRRWLSRKRGVAVRVVDTAHGQQAVLAADPGTHEPGRCPRCGREPGAVSGAVSIRQCEDALVAVAGVEPTPRRGKRFDLPPAHAVPALAELLAMEAALLAELDVSLPVSPLPRWSGIVNPALHGMHTHADVFQPRQRVVLLALIKALREEHHVLAREHGDHAARWAVSALSALLDQCVDWNCRLSMWIPANEQVGRAFCGPGVAMLWDWAETDPVGPGPSNLHGKLARLVAGARWIGRLPRPATVLRAAAQSLPHPDASFDAVVTDPPYYDNLYYSVLADFFYPWKRMLLAGVAPELFADATTETDRELVASTQRSGDPRAAHARYVTELAAALTEAARVMKPDAILALVYGHSALDGWAALIEAFGRAPLVITSVHPLALEREQRPRAMTAQAQQTSLVLVARRLDAPRAHADGAVPVVPGALGDVENLGAPEDIVHGVDLEAICRHVSALCSGSFAAGLAAAGWGDAAISLVAFGRGAALWASAGLPADARAVRAGLATIERAVRERFPAFRLARRRSQ
jgi:putative DNA methylase